MYRYLSPLHYNFDTRSESLNLPRSTWEENVKRQHEENRKATIEGLTTQYGSTQLDDKLKAFKEFGRMPMSVIFEHTSRFWQVRDAFVAGAHYPALAATCALGEKILNHMVLNLRAHYPNKARKASVYDANSIANWHTAIQALEDWEVLRKGVGTAFRKLSAIRNRALHADPRKAEDDRSEALSAIRMLKQILEDQFGTWGLHEWFIRGTKGHLFIKRDWEKNPFISTYYTPNTVLVSPYFRMLSLQDGLWAVVDRADVQTGSTISDEAFCQLFNDRRPEELVPDSIPMAPSLHAFMLVPGKHPVAVTLVNGSNGIGVSVLKPLKPRT